MFPFDQILTEEEKKELINNYKTLEEGYIILYLKAEFEKRGYKVSRDRADLRFERPGGNIRNFDLMIEKDSNRQYIDYLNGTMYQEDFFRFFDKALELSKDIYIITKDEEILFNHAKFNCFKWIANRFGSWENAKGKVNFHFSTLQWLITNERVWEDMIIQ